MKQCGRSPGCTTGILPALRRTVSAFRATGRLVVHVVPLYEEGRRDERPT
jgi:hypothetical protein